LDERLGNIYKEIGHFEKYYFKVNDAELANHVFKALEQISEEREAINVELTLMKSYYTQQLDEMGKFFYNFVKNSFNEINFD
jgi:hypothetical protein